MSEDERIDRYFSGEMDDLKRTQFDQEVMNNPKFAEAVKNYKDLILGVKSFGLQQEIRSIMSDTQGKTTNEVATSKTGTKIRWWYILIIAGIVSLSYLIIQQNAPPNATEQLYIAYYYADPGLPSTMGETAGATFSGGMVQYKNHQYRDALKTWSSLSSISDDKTTYYSALCLHELKGHEAARKKLRAIEASSPYFQQAMWYRSLIDLKLGDKETAVDNLSVLSKLPDSIYSQRARELLAKLTL